MLSQVCLCWWLFKWESQSHPEAVFSEAPAGWEVLCASRAEVLLPALSPSCAASNSLSCASSRYLLLKTHQLSLDAFLVALKFMQVEGVDIAEVQCILANLIYMVCALQPGWGIWYPPCPQRLWWGRRCVCVCVRARMFRVCVCVCVCMYTQARFPLSELTAR